MLRSWSWCPAFQITMNQTTDFTIRSILVVTSISRLPKSARSVVLDRDKIPIYSPNIGNAAMAQWWKHRTRNQGVPSSKRARTTDFELRLHFKLNKNACGSILSTVLKVKQVVLWPFLMTILCKSAFTLLFWRVWIYFLVFAHTMCSFFLNATGAVAKW